MGPFKKYALGKEGRKGLKKKKVTERKRHMMEGIQLKK